MPQSSIFTVHSRVRIGLMLAALLILTLALGACSQAPQGPVTIAVSIPMFQGYEARLLSSIELAADEHNNLAGNVPVELLILDSSDYATGGTTPFSPEKELENMRQAAENPSVVAYIGTAGSSIVQEGLPAMNEAGLAYISTGATWPGLTQPGFGPGEPGIYYPTGERTLFRLLTNDASTAATAPEVINELFDAQTVYIVHDGSRLGTGAVGVFEVGWVSDLGLEIVGNEAYDPATATEQDYQAITDRVIAADPDALFWVADSDRKNSYFISTFRQTNDEMPILTAGMASWLFPFTFASYTGLDVGLLDGIYLIQGHLAVTSYTTELSKAYFAALEARGGEIGHTGAPPLYEATNAAFAAIAKAKKPTREGVLESLQNFGEYTGIWGTWSFDANGDRSLATVEVTIFASDTLTWQPVTTIIRER